VVKRTFSSRRTSEGSAPSPPLFVLSPTYHRPPIPCQTLQCRPSPLSEFVLNLFFSGFFLRLCSPSLFHNPKIGKLVATAPLNSNLLSSLFLSRLSSSVSRKPMAYFLRGQNETSDSPVLSFCCSGVHSLFAVFGGLYKTKVLLGIQSSFFFSRTPV